MTSSNTGMALSEHSTPLERLAFWYEWLTGKAEVFHTYEGVPDLDFAVRTPESSEPAHGV